MKLTQILSATWFCSFVARVMGTCTHTDVLTQGETMRYGVILANPEKYSQDITIMSNTYTRILHLASVSILVSCIL